MLISDAHIHPFVVFNALCIQQIAKRVMVPKLPEAKTYDYIDVLADSKEEFLEEWNTTAKDAEVKRVLARTPYWCTFPDYERV